MSNSDSFIEEVTEEVQREKLFGYLRRYGWIGVLAVLVLVGGAGINEYLRSRDRAQAQALGDSLLAAVQNEDAAARAQALGQIDAADDAQALVTLIAAGAAVNADDPAQATALLQGLIDTPDLPPVYRQLASLKLVMAAGDDMTTSEKRALIGPLAEPGQPFSLLAGEQLALLDVVDGNTDAAIERLRTLSQDHAATAGLRDRARQLIVALGGTP